MAIDYDLASIGLFMTPSVLLHSEQLNSTQDTSGVGQDSGDRTVTTWRNADIRDSARGGGARPARRVNDTLLYREAC